MEFLFIALIALATILILTSGVAERSVTFEERAIRLAMDALRKTVDTVPLFSTEYFYFPPPPIMEATLYENFNPDQMRLSLTRIYGAAKPELAAYHLLDYVEHAFFRTNNSHMAAWCHAAKGTLDEYVDEYLKANL